MSRKTELKSALRKLRFQTIKETGKKPTKAEYGEALKSIDYFFPETQKENWKPLSTDPERIGDALRNLTSPH